MHLHPASEIAEPADEAADCLGAVAAVEVGRAQISVWEAVAEHVVAGGEHGGGYREDGFLAPGGT